MSEPLPKQKSEKNMKKNTTKTRRPKVGKLVKRYIKRIYNITGINPMEMVKGKDGKMIPKNINTVRKLVRRKFSHLDSHGLNKHIKAFYDEEYKNPSLTRKFKPFGSNISNDISNLIERFNTNIPFITPNVIKSERKYDEYGIPIPREIKYDYDDMRFDKYSGIKNDIRRYAVDIVNEIFKGVNGEQSEKMRTNIIDAIHNIKLETDPNESNEDIENRYKEAILKIIDNIEPLLYTFGMNDSDSNAVINSLNNLKQKLIDCIKDDDFDVDNDPIENYRESVEYGIRRMLSDGLTDELLMDLNGINTLIESDENEEYDDDTIDKIDQKLKHFSENIGLKQIDGIVVDRALRRKYHEIIPKIEKYLHRGYNVFFGNNQYKLDMIDYMYNKYLTDTDAINNANENTDDKEIDKITDANRSIDAKGGLRDQIVKEAVDKFNETGQTTRKTDRKNIDQNMIADIIASKLDRMNDVRIDTIREVVKDVLEGIKGKAESHATLALANKTTDIMAGNIVNRLFDIDEFRNMLLHEPMKSMGKYVNMKPIERFEMIPPEDKEEAIIKRVIDILERSKKEEDLELSESSESSTIESVNEEEEAPIQSSIEVSDDVANEDQDDVNISNEMSEGSGEQLNTSTFNKELAPQSLGFISNMVNEIVKKSVAEGDIAKEMADEYVDDIIKRSIDKYGEGDEEGTQTQLQAQQSTGVQSMPIDRNDYSTLVSSLDNLNNRITALSQSPSSTDTNNILGGIVSIFKELPNGMDDEIANRLSEATGPDGKKLFESKEEAARFIAKMRALNSNRLSSIKGGGQKHAIQLNITNKVVSNMPKKPFIVDTHPIPYQY